MRKRGHIGGALALLLILSVTVAAQEYQPGAVVRLVERELHIPAHPAPGDGAIPFRFQSGSTGTILAIDDQTGWLQLQGTQDSGGQNTGWITQRYIAEMLGEQDTTVSGIAWCPEKGPPTPARPGRLRIATWNIASLHAEDGEATYTGSRPSVKRTAPDYDRIRCYIRLFDPDILAVQEVDGEAALSRVVDMDVYDLHVSDRPRGTLNGRQNTGFAFKRGLDVTRRPDFTALDVDGTGRLRYGARIDVRYNGQTIRMMSVHLKSGCFQDSSDSSPCDRLFRQVPVLEGWIDAAAQRPEPFIVLGDFNRRFNLDGDRVWADIDDGIPPDADLTTVTYGMPISCRSNRYPEFIDHIVLDRRALAWLDRTSFRHLTFRQQDKQDWDKISDHCPVIVELWIE